MTVNVCLALPTRIVLCRSSKKVKILQNYDKPIQEAINRANQAKMFNLAVQMAAFSKCQGKPENDDIDAAIKAILAPIDPEQDEAPAPEAAAPAAPAAPAPEAAAPAAN